MTTNKKAANGNGTIRKKTVTRNGLNYTYWEARVTIVHDAGTGKQIQKSFTGKTQKEVREKLRAAAVNIDNGTYQEPSKITLSEWLDIWTAEYLGDVKPHTSASYNTQVRNHIKPALGAVKLQALSAPQIQRFYNSMGKGEKPLSPKTIKNVHGVLHKALQQAVDIGYINYNPSDACKLPRVVKKEIKPMDEIQIGEFLNAIKGHRFETLYTVTLFTGMREGEALGLKWDCVDFKKGTILIDKQLQREKKKGGQYIFAPLKNDKSRIITPAPFVMSLLRQHSAKQAQQHLAVADIWENSGLVFTDEKGHHLAIHTVYKDFKKIVSDLGYPELRFHDLRHSYAVASIRAGDDIKTVQGNLGHATAAFTLDVYGHVTEQMKRESANRMEGFIQSVLAQ